MRICDRIFELCVVIEHALKIFLHLCHGAARELNQNGQVKLLSLITLIHVCHRVYFDEEFHGLYTAGTHTSNCNLRAAAGTTCPLCVQLTCNNHETHPNQQNHQKCLLSPAS